MLRSGHISFFSRLRIGIFICILLGLEARSAFALSNDALFQHAREAYAAKNELALAEDVGQLKNQQYVLAPYADYWLMLLRLEGAEDAEVQNFLKQYADMPFADRVRGEWLKKLGGKQSWAPFFEQYELFQRDDVVVQCYALLGHVELGDAEFSKAGITGQVKALWLTSAELPSNCGQLFDIEQKAGRLTADDVWVRFRLILLDDKIAFAKKILGRLPDSEVGNLKLLDRANSTPQSLFDGKGGDKKKQVKKNSDKKAVTFKTRYDVEVALYALDRLARTNLESAISALEKVQNSFEPDDQAYAWGRVAYYAARGHHPKALEFYALAKNVNLDKEQLAWQVRAALRAKDWDAVQRAITTMQPAQAGENAWRYWKARALKEQNRQGEANIIFAQLAKERHYYGWLAADELGGLSNYADEDYVATEMDVAAVADQPAIKRALELQRLNMRWEAKIEWAWATRGFDDKQLLAAAEYAARQQWYDIAIITADNTKQVHNFNLRYPMPYRDLFKSSTYEQNLDEAWVYGLTRQESRFMHYAKSGVGASGLMQLMPATAKWVAKRKGMDDYRSSMLHDLGTNIEIGTYYMRYTLDLMNGQAAMATAAYNAGPSRARRWAAAEPLEAAIYIETIPFTETRNYVQKVMANAHLYAIRLGMTTQTLKSRLGVIPGSTDSAAVVEAKNE